MGLAGRPLVIGVVRDDVNGQEMKDGVLADLLVVECQNGKYSLALSTDLNGLDCCAARN